MALPNSVVALSDSETEREGGASQNMGLEAHPVDHDGLAGRQHALEIFAGSGILTAAINRYKGMKCWSKDIKRCALEDITKPNEWKLICCAIDTKFLDYIHLAPPCNQYSVARWPKLRIGVVVICSVKIRCVMLLKVVHFPR